VDAFDADVLIYAAAGHPLGRRVRTLLDERPTAPAGIGSVLLVPEVLGKPLRGGHADEVEALARVLGRLELVAVDEATAELASVLGAGYGLRAADAVHLATGVGAGADRFITNNARDFPRSIAEIEVTYPADLGGARGSASRARPRR
jgi:predicted nucleic acid-binding protein